MAATEKGRAPSTQSVLAFRISTMKSLANLVSSLVSGVVPSTKKSDVSLMRSTISLVSGGMMIRKACLVLM